MGFAWFFLGVGVGTTIMWIHFYTSGLIRSREEYSKAKNEGRGSME